MAFLKRAFVLTIALLGVIGCLISLSSISVDYPKQFFNKEEPASKPPKRILLWNKFFSMVAFNFGLEKKAFEDHNCKVSNCLTTTNRENVEDFDVIVFHAPQINYSDLPKKRRKEQIYLFFDLEPPEVWPVYSQLDDFFNITMTYRLESDIFMPYFKFKDVNNKTISPKYDPEWMQPQYLNQKPAINGKTKPAAWFVSRCTTGNKREEKVRELQKYIQVDVYGACGNFSCPRSIEDECFDLLKKDYFFYLSYENSNCKDYVTEKVLNAMQHGLIPVVFNGADIAKFLPPHSYLDAGQLSTQELAETMKMLMNDSEKYSEYFWWKDYYWIDKFYSPPFCELCEIINYKLYREKSYKISEWWHGTFENPMCS